MIRAVARFVRHHEAFDHLRLGCATAALQDTHHGEHSVLLMWMFFRIELPELWERAPISSRPAAGGFQPLAAIGLGPAQDANAGAEALLEVRALPEDGLAEVGLSLGDDGYFFSAPGSTSGCRAWSAVPQKNWSTK